MGCASQDVELPEQTVGRTDVRRSILKRNGKRSPRAYLELKDTKTADRFIKHRAQLGPSLGVIQGGHKHHRHPNAPTFENVDPNNTLWADDDARNAGRSAMGQGVVKKSWDVLGERRCIFQTKVCMCSSINFSRQSRRKRVYCCFWCIYAHEEQDGFTTRRIGNSQRVSTSRDKHQTILRMARLYFPSAITSCLSSFLVDQAKLALRVSAEH